MRPSIICRATTLTFRLSELSSSGEMVESKSLPIITATQQDRALTTQAYAKGTAKVGIFYHLL